MQAAADALVEAARAALPSDLLSRIVAENARAARAPRRSGSGAAATSARRGAPAGSRPGRLRPGDRLNLPETLRAAAPWQRLRARADGSAAALIRVRPDDFRIRRFVQRREQTAIFVVDASGSSALQRLAEAKGAVELLLARAYVSRDRVALIAFRGQGAETLLAPTRSLTRAKRSLAELPGAAAPPSRRGSTRRSPWRSPSARGSGRRCWSCSRTGAPTSTGTGQAGAPRRSGTRLQPPS